MLTVLGRGSIASMALLRSHSPEGDTKPINYNITKSSCLNN